jgi:hypothetical protein
LKECRFLHFINKTSKDTFEGLKNYTKSIHHQTT